MIACLHCGEPGELVCAPCLPDSSLYWCSATLKYATRACMVNGVPRECCVFVGDVITRTDVARDLALPGIS